ncbi:DegT/DnrJ/EryC1/StrS family aminotransferase [Nostocoides jenkinsii]|uniref:Putative aminotransferase n=1 Tax=Nostocoides jenkinsii Ben 74 TaxID=1193518 RepID=A0A077M814_9MICO|nr:aminotransferase class I/II-fold pyridoxal phosphate-dependent enzyme [Tetrasphaera jenkinsii]CCI52025.1 putative aminotransferase [Tetrasphaera jenkinsii Ben 74]
MSSPVIALSVPDLGPAEAAAAAASVDVVRGGKVDLGAIEQFERGIAEVTGCRYAVALSSGTAALHLALIHLGARPGTVVLTSSMTFAATANAIRYTGAEPVFVDSQASDANVNPHLLLNAADQLLAQGREIAAAVPVDLYGRCADYSVLEPGLRERGIPLLCDAAESLGAAHNGRPAGSFGEAGVFSFNVNKLLTTLGGGMLVSDDEDLVAHARKLATQARENVPWYEHTELGFNYRMTHTSAAIGNAQLARLPELLAARRAIRDGYAGHFADVPSVRILGRDAGDGGDNCWLTSIVVNDPTFDAAAAVAALQAEGIEARQLWKPMHLQPVYADATVVGGELAEDLFARGLNLPSSSVLTDSELDRVVERLTRWLDAQ